MEDANTFGSKNSIISISLHQYVFDFLEESNKKLYRPLESVYLFYCAQLFENNLHSHAFFKNEELGLTLLQSMHGQDGPSDQKIKEVAEKAFLTCAYFGDSKKSKIVGINYYAQICKNAFLILNSLRPIYLENKNFFLNYAAQTNILFALLSDLKQDQKIQSFWDLFQSKTA